MRNPQQSAKRWKTNLSSPSAQEKAKSSIQQLTVSPLALAAQQQDKMLAKITESVTSGRYAAACNAVPLQKWQQDFLTKALPRFATGAAAAESDMAIFFQHHNQVCDQIKQSVRAMPKLTEGDSIARVVAAMTMMKQAYGKTI